MERNSSDVKAKSSPRRKPAGAAVLQESVTLALHRACFEEWAESGYAAMRMDLVAARAGVGKAALYRRYKSKWELVRTAVSTAAVSITPIPDSGSFKGDILRLMQSFAVVLRHPLVRRILPDLHAEKVRSVDLAKLLESITRDRRAQAEVILDRAVERGELAQGIDYDLALDLLIAPLYWRVVIQRKSVSAAYIQRLADGILASLSVPEQN